MLKVHFAVTHSAPGGLLELWNDIAAGLCARGYDVTRFAIYPEFEEPPPGPGWHHVTTSRPGSLLAALKLLYMLIRYLRANRPQVIVTAMPAANVLLPLAVIMARTSTQIIATHHSPVETHNRLLNLLDGWTGLLPRVRAIVSVSNTVAASLARKPHAYRKKCRTIHNALPEHIEQLLAGLATSVSRRPLEEGRIVALGRLAYQKNYPMLIAAMTQLSNAHLHIVGGGEDEADLRAQAEESGVGDRVHFLGYLPREEALVHAASADVFVQVSHFEGHSLALIEAARLGLPLVVSDVPVQVEGITARDGTCCGIVVPLDDVTKLADVLRRLLMDAAWHESWAARARQLGAEFSNAQMLKHYERLLHAAVARLGPPSMTDTPAQEGYREASGVSGVQGNEPESAAAYKMG